ncbi:hypothetical protein T4A_99 [Trichinella pseudospiralis]|uniref:Uncharacterized protein n=1 Tax=Trichinella pseudospiralis TaxID=6337 RepID=A0A0V1DTN6_TRIPS|nr:hypothetical protein T4A_99 [Trichinella pseudospiralis]
MGWRDEGPAGRTRRAAAIRHECPSLAWRGLGPGPKRTPEHHIDLRVSNDAQSGETSEIGMSYTRGKTVTDTGRHRTREHNERLPQKKVHSGGTWHEHLDTADRSEKDREEKRAEVRDSKRKKKKKAEIRRPSTTAGSTIPTGTGVTTTPRGNREKRLTRKVTAPSCHKLPTASTRKQQARESRKRGSGTASGTATDPSHVNRERTACQYLSPGPIGTDRKDHKHKRDREESDRPQRIPGSHTWGGGPKMTP